MTGPLCCLQLGNALRGLRQAAGVSCADAGSAVELTESQIGHIETGRRRVGKAALLVLARDMYGASPEVVTELERWRVESRKPGWWSTYKLPAILERYLCLETYATAIGAMQLEVIPGLLQTESYTRVMCAHLPVTERAGAVSVRTLRQQRLTDGSGSLHLCAVISEGALVRCAREPALAGEQFAKLIESAEWPTVDMRVLPFSAGLHRGSPFTLFTFAEGILPAAASQEYALGGHLIDTASVVSDLFDLMSELRKKCLSPRESVTMIKQFAQAG